jgi:hypothetical protein
MRPLPVVVERMLGADTAQVSLVEDQHSVGDLGAVVKTRRSATQFARGRRGAISRTPYTASPDSVVSPAFAPVEPRIPRGLPEE